MQLHETRMHRTVFEMDGYCLKDVRTQFFPGVGFGERCRVPARERNNHLLLGVTNLERLAPCP